MTTATKTESFAQLADDNAVIEFRYGAGRELRCGRIIDQTNGMCNPATNREIITVEMFGMGGGYRTFFTDRLRDVAIVMGE